MSNKPRCERGQRLTQPIGGRRMPPCRDVEVVDGVLYAFFAKPDGKVTCMTLAQFLANSGAKVRVP